MCVANQIHTKLLNRLGPLLIAFFYKKMVCTFSKVSTIRILIVIVKTKEVMTCVVLDFVPLVEVSNCLCFFTWILFKLRLLYIIYLVLAHTLGDARVCNWGLFACLNFKDEF